MGRVDREAGLAGSAMAALKSASPGGQQNLERYGPTVPTVPHLQGKAAQRS